MNNERDFVRHDDFVAGIEERDVDNGNADAEGVGVGVVGVVADEESEVL